MADDGKNMLATQSVNQGAATDKPRFAFKTRLNADDLTGFYRTHLARHHKKGMWVMAGAGVFLIGLAAYEFFALRGTQGWIFELGCGLGFLALSFLLAPILTRSAVKGWKGPVEARYRFFEDGFEARGADGPEWHGYQDITEVSASRGTIYLYVARNRAFVLTAQAVSGRQKEFLEFLEQKIGRRLGKRPA